MFSKLLSDEFRREWSQFLEYLTPQIFEVIPSKDLAKITGRLGQNFVRRRHDSEEAGIRKLMKSLRLPVDFRSKRDSSEMLPSLSRRERSEIILTLFFAQLLSQKTAWLDFRSHAFELLSKEMLWQPRPWLFTWDPDFLAAVRKINVGLFLNQQQLLREGLSEVRIDHAADVLLENFGPSAQLDLRFHLKDMRQGLHKVFLGCKNAKIRLHANFFPLGIMVAGLYQHLESLGESIDVHACFMKAWDRLSAEERSNLQGADWSPQSTTA